MSDIDVLVKFSHKYGSNEEYVLAGGGNTSCKDKDHMYVKGSGTSLATIREDQFVKIGREKLDSIWDRTYSADTKERESQVLADLMASREEGEEGKRPSVETLLHGLFPHKYVLHLHPTKVNALTCSVNGEKTVRKMFPDAVWVDESEPGYVLAALCRKMLAEYREKKGKDADLLFLQNHGIFFAAKTVKELDALVDGTMAKIESKIKKVPDFSEAEADNEKVLAVAPVIKMLYGTDGKASVRFEYNAQIAKFCESEKAFSVLYGPLSPDHIVYCKAEPLFVNGDTAEDVKKAFADYTAKYGWKPKIIFVKGTGMFAAGNTAKEALTASKVWFDAMKITLLAANFGGVRKMSEHLVDFIVNWEVESYRSKVSLSSDQSKQFAGKTAIVTGSAQGFGEGIARFLASGGANVVIADMNKEGADKTAVSIADDTGASTISVGVNVTDEESVNAMINETVKEFGGIDIFVNNAGIVRAGSLDEMTRRNFDLVTSVNYTAYFLCTKYVSKVMKVQTAADSGYMCDIIEINSKSGLTGSNKNFAYAGSKFGGLGLTQSFALELAPYNIKVNAVCPGNFLDGPLWSDPKNGLFVQYLNAGKVPGAKTVADVKKYYEAKVPLGRGCRIEDVARAVSYIISQKYETGQAVPVTCGQNMLN